jgi:UDP-N-acetyl-D-glucosamine dehydrogenase
VGGNCIPIDPNYLSYRVQARLGYPFRFVELAQEINEGMPAYVARRVQDLLNDRGWALKGANVLLLGVTYKPDISDQQESPAVPVAHKIIDHGGVVSFHDPPLVSWNVDGEEFKRVPDLDVVLCGCDLAVLLQAHTSYALDALVAAARLVLGTPGLPAPRRECGGSVNEPSHSRRR